MLLSDTQKRYITDNLISTFHRSEEDVARTMILIQDFIDGKNEFLIYELQYRLFVSEDFEYGKKLSRFIFEAFSYLYDTSKNIDKEIIFKNMSYLFESLFIKKYIYDNRIEKQTNAALNVLKHISHRLNSNINTQDRMIGALSHEMRTSLNAIVGYLSIIDNENSLNYQNSEYLKKAIRASKTLQSLIKDILDITKLNSEQMEISKSWFLLDDLMLECIEQIDINMKENKKIDFIYSPTFVPYYVYGDKMHLMEILINFLTNAYKYTQKGYIAFKMEYEHLSNGIKVIFSVADTGAGIDNEQKKHIFSAYNRYHKDKEGLGLGLYIAKSLAEKMEGNIYLQSEIGKGSIFYFEILFTDIKSYNPDFKDKNILFLYEKDEYSIYFKKKLEYLSKYGAYIKVFRREINLISYIFENRTHIPDIISFYAKSSNISKYDALVYYLKNDNRYTDCIFTAEGVSPDLSLKYFNRVAKFDLPISQYNSFFIHNRYGVSSKDIKTISFKLLLVDDIDTNLEIFKILVKKDFPNIEIDTTKSAHEALGMCKVKRYDILFVDLKMPDLSGYDLIDKMRVECSILPPVYAFTADIYNDTYLKLKERGFEGVVEKPLNMEKLYQIFKRHL